jgi:hypothetical protein
MEGFGPSSNWKADHVQLIFPIPLILEDQEDPIILSYIFGPKNTKPSLRTTTYIPYEDLNEGDFIFNHSFDPIGYLVWMGRMYNDVVKDGNDKHYKMVHVQWWVPYKKKIHNNVELYQDY